MCLLVKSGHGDLIVSFTLAGSLTVAALLEASQRTATSAATAMREEAELIMTEAKLRTPVDTGALRASGQVVGPTPTSEGYVIGLEFGDAAVTYAVPVHEDLFMRHRVGQAKFLESALLEAVPTFLENVAARMQQS